MQYALKLRLSCSKLLKKKNLKRQILSKCPRNKTWKNVAPFPTENNENFHSESYLSAATKLDEHRVNENPITTSFHIVRGLLEQDKTNSDDDTVIPNKNTSIWVYIICIGPKDIKEEEAPCEAIRKMNQMIKCLINKIPSVKLGIWNHESYSSNKFLTELPEDVDTVEWYVHDFNRFISPGKNLYCRLHLYYNSGKTSIAEIESVLSSFKKPRVQFMSLAHSDAISPVAMGTFTGSVKEMAESPDFYLSLKKTFGLKSLGLWWAFPKSEVTWTKDTKKWATHYEIDHINVDKGGNDAMMMYFNRNSAKVDENFFGTPMSIAPIFSHFHDDDTKMKCTKYTKSIVF